MKFDSMPSSKPIYFLAMCFLMGTCNNKKDDNARSQKRDIPAVLVSTLVVQLAELQNQIEVAGSILPNERVDLKSEVAGRITGIYFKEGEKVRKGKLLVKIFDQEVQAQLRKAEFQLQLAQAEESRRKKLIDINAISAEEYEVSLNQSNTLKADIDLLQAQLRRTLIIAPFDGVIGLRNVSEGENVSVATLISTLQQIDPIKIEFDIPEKYSGNVVPSSTINFTVTGSEQVFQGQVYATEPAIDQTTRTLKVRARSSNQNQLLKPGAFIKINVILSKDKSALMVPTQALIPGATGQKLYVYERGMAMPRNVTTGMRQRADIQITKGLEAQDTVIISGILQLKDSVKVKIMTKG